MVITLLHPSRSRPEKAKETFEHWLHNSSKKIQIEHILSIDDSDPEKAKYHERFSPPLTSILKNKNTCVVEATNVAAKKSSGAVLVYLSDDFKCPENWDLLITEKFREVNTPLLIKVDDMLKPFSDPILTIPIMNRALYEKLNYFWHPEYRSMFCDDHLYALCKKHHWIQFAPDLKFEHCHHTVGKAPDDETYYRSLLNWEQGQATYKKHKKAGFPLSIYEKPPSIAGNIKAFIFGVFNR